MSQLPSHTHYITALSRLSILDESAHVAYSSSNKYVCTYVKIRRHQHTRVHAHTGPRRHTPELRRVTDTTSHGLSAGRHSTQTTIGSPSSLCDRPRGGGGRGAARKLLGLRASRQVGFVG